MDIRVIGTLFAIIDKYNKIVMNSMSGVTEEEQTSNINKIVKTYETRSNIDKYSREISMKEIDLHKYQIIDKINIGNILCISLFHVQEREAKE